jgi:hypothetical protein
MSFWGILVPGDLWRIALVSSIISIVGIVLFLGNWPTFNTIAALAVNVAVIVTRCGHWPLRPCLEMRETMVQEIQAIKALPLPTGWGA